MILLPAQIEGIQSRKDKTIKLTICYFAIKVETFQKDELEDLNSLKSDLETNKTPSQRLRGILYLNYEKDNEGYKDFTTYYVSKMERICDHYKTKLD